MNDDPRSFRSSRVLAASPERVYAAFADASQLARWWGPDGFRNEFERFEFQPGGAWNLVMVGPDGQRYANQNRFVELLPAARIVIRHEGAPFFSLSVELSPADGGTRLVWTQVFDDAAVAAAVRPIVEPANEQNLDRLAAVLAST
ncbi:MAG: SRPBCC domain-containing protein [Burkholderiaceae bacterium]|nr:SRPBCC domain-containing protein [Burkholderiaceae bacterium]